MERKFRLKKWYPSLPTILKSVVEPIAYKVENDYLITVYNNSSSSGWYMNSMSSSGNINFSQFHIPTLEVENNPDFWEEILDKEALYNNKLLSLKDLAEVWGNASFGDIITSPMFQNFREKAEKNMRKL